MLDHAQNAKPWIDVNPKGKWPEQLPHRYLADLGQIDDCCQFVAGGTRCRSTEFDHVRTWPELYRKNKE